MKKVFFPDRPIYFLGELATAANVSRRLMRMLLDYNRIPITRIGNRNVVLFADLMNIAPTLVESMRLVRDWNKTHES